MALDIKTFSAATGGNAAFKALGHPLAAAKTRALVERLENAGPVALYDPAGHAAELAALYDFSRVNVAGLYVQNLTDVGRTILGHEALPVTRLNETPARTILVCAYDAGPVTGAIRHLIPEGADIVTLDELRLPDDMLTNPRRYLDTLNFATNFVFFREGGGHHTRMVTANYWSGYGAKQVWLWCCLFDDSGREIAQWRHGLGQGPHLIAIDSREVRQRFNLGDFTGSLFVHAVGVAGHDIVKYALDTYGDDGTALSCTHDANAWPSLLYAGLPAPDKGETVTLWVQNSHPCAIPAGAIGLNLMGSDAVVPLDREIAPFATHPIDVGNLLPTAAWPQQLEIQSGMHFVRPRYEVKNAAARLRIAHANVERSDLKPDPAIPGLGFLMGKGYILPAPILPPDRYDSVALPTPMSTAQTTLPLALLVYNADGEEILRHPVGTLARRDSVAFDIGDLLRQYGKAGLGTAFGHMELIYDFAAGGDADGWLHGLFRYADRETGHEAETSFGSHIFNTMLVYKGEPQSYAGRPPGLSTRLFLRTAGNTDTDALCHLVYPASTPWHATSQTDLVLYDGLGQEKLKKTVRIPCSGSLLWRYHEMFNEEERAQGGPDAYVLIRDATCRLFGYHGLIRDGQAFSLDHMFGF